MACTFCGYYFAPIFNVDKMSINENVISSYTSSLILRGKKGIDSYWNQDCPLCVGNQLGAIAQKVTYLIKGTTSGEETVKLTLNGDPTGNTYPLYTNNILKLPIRSTWNFKASINGISSGSAASFSARGVITKDRYELSRILESPIIESYKDNDFSNASISVEVGSEDDLAFYITGVDSETTTWFGTVEIIQVRYVPSLEPPDDPPEVGS